MTDLSITAASVKAGSNASTVSGIAGASITAGQCVFRDGTTGRFALSDADGAGTKQVTGVALNNAAADQPLQVLTAGDIIIGATLTAGTTYYASPVAGGICPLADVASGDDPIIVGIAKSTTQLMVRITDPDVTI